MKTLTLIRHAKSSWQYPGLADMDRPLNERGRTDAPLMGRVLARRGFAAQRLVTSTALRALRTAEAIAAALGRPSSWIGLDERWYHLEVDALIEVIRSFPPELDWVACVGHNPALADLANRLGAERLDHVPTGAVVQLRFKTDDWTALGSVKACEVDSDWPKNHYRNGQAGQIEP